MSGKAHRGRKRDRAKPGHENCRFCSVCGYALMCPDCDVDGLVCVGNDECLAVPIAVRSTRQHAVDVHPPVVVDERDQLPGDDPQPAQPAPRPAARLTHPDPRSGGNRHVNHDTRDDGQ